MCRYVYGSIFAALLTAGALACTSSQTSTAVTAPASAKCQVQVGSTPTTFTSDGGKGMLAVTTTRDCVWSVSTSASWISLANTDGQGEASVPYTVAVNPVPVARAAAITVSDATLQLSQAGAPCRFTLSSSGASIGAAGGPLAVEISTLTGCTWTAATDAPWLTLTSGGSGNGSGSIGMLVAANSGTARSAHMTAGDQTYTVIQSAAAPAPSPTPTPAPPPAVVQLSGVLSGLSGKCPTVSFTVGSTAVTANSLTVYVDGKCSDLRNGHDVSVTGTTQSDNSVLATLIDLKP